MLFFLLLICLLALHAHNYLPIFFSFFYFFYYYYSLFVVIIIIIIKYFNNFVPVSSFLFIITTYTCFLCVYYY